MIFFTKKDQLSTLRSKSTPYGAPKALRDVFLLYEKHILLRD